MKSIAHPFVVPYNNLFRYVVESILWIILPKEKYVAFLTWICTGKVPNIHHPRSFNEKIHWLKLNYRNPRLTTLTDKYEVRRFVKNRIGSDYLVPLLGVYETVEDIPFDDLPDAFVLKVTHGSGMSIICRDKNAIRWNFAKSKMERWLRQNYYYRNYEWAYLHIKPRIICERLLLDEGGKIPRDYKLFCFNGVTRFIQVDVDRFSHHTRNFYDANWNKLDVELMYPGSEAEIPRPEKLEEMIGIAHELSHGFPFCRVDLYFESGKVFFGEMAFYPGNGYEPFRPSEADYEFGAQLHLPADTRSYRDKVVRFMNKS